MPGGQLFLSVGGKPFASDTTTGAISGGTGTYAGAVGSFTSAGEDSSKDTIHIWIPLEVVASSPGRVGYRPR